MGRLPRENVEIRQGAGGGYKEKVEQRKCGSFSWVNWSMWKPQINDEYFIQFHINFKCIIDKPNPYAQSIESKTKLTIRTCNFH